MIVFVVQIDGALAPVTPDYRLIRSINVNLEGHVRLPNNL
jgi:hypothetical protein